MSGEKRKKELKDGIVQLVKYNIVGVINTLVDFLVYQLLTYLGMKYAIAQCISYSCGILNSYFFNSRWTFKRDSGRSKKEFIYFVAQGNCYAHSDAGQLFRFQAFRIQKMTLQIK